MSFPKIAFEASVILEESSVIEKSDRDRDRRTISPRSSTASHITDRADTHQIAETKAQFAIRGVAARRPHDAIWLCLPSAAPRLPGWRSGQVNRLAGLLMALRVGASPATSRPAFSEA
jgi:hypothetical protein